MPSPGSASVTRRRLLRPAQLLEVAEDLGDDALARLDRAVQVALEVDRRVLAGKVAVALPLALHACERRVLAHLPVGVRALRPFVARPEVDRRLAVPVVGEAGQDRIDLLQELRSPARSGALPEARPDRSSGVIDEDARLAILGA